jgi:serine/threonine-protein kinase PRP4
VPLPLPRKRKAVSMFDDASSDEEDADGMAGSAGARPGAAGAAAASRAAAGSAAGAGGVAELAGLRERERSLHGSAVEDASEAGGAGGTAASAAALRDDELGLHPSLADNWDDAEGYYKIKIGETIGGRYQVLGSRGRGVFSSVLYCRDTMAEGAADARPLDAEDDSTVEEAAAGTIATAAAPMALTSSGALVRSHAALATGSSSYVAIKIIRANDTMRRAGQKELDILRTLATADPAGRYHCVRLLHAFEHRNHLCLAFEPLNMNLKEVQNKFGKGVGISVSAVRNYAKQMLLALSLLSKLRVVHADIKPHNILANDRYNVIKVRASERARARPRPRGMAAHQSLVLCVRCLRSPFALNRARRTGPLSSSSLPASVPHSCAMPAPPPVPPLPAAR